MSAAKPGSAAGSRLVLRLPDGWEALPLDADAARALVRERLEHAAAMDLDMDPSAVRRIAALTAYMVKDLRRAGIGLAAVWSQVVAEEDVDAQPPELLVATMMITPVPGGRSGAPSTPAVLKATLETRDTGPDLRPLEHPAEVELPIGIAVRQAALRRLRSPEPGEPPTVILLDRYLVPLEGNGVAVVDFCTPNLEAQDDFRELFRSMAGSLEMAS